MRAVRRLLRQSKDVFWTSGALAAAQILMVATGMVTARFLGPGGKGLVTGITTWAFLLAWAAGGGLSTAVSVRISSLPEHDIRKAVGQSLGNALAFVLCVGLPVTAISAAVVPPLMKDSGLSASSMSTWILFAIPLIMLWAILSAVQLSLANRRIYNLGLISAPAVTLIMTLAYLASGASLSPDQVIVATIVGSLVSVIVVSAKLPWSALALGRRSLGHDLKFGLKLHLGNLFRLTNFRIDILAMSILVSATQIGLYSVATTFMLPVLLLANGAATLLTPKIATMRANVASDSNHAYEPVSISASVIRREARGYTALAFIGGIAVAVLAPWIVPLLLGSQYAPSVELIWILLPGYVCLSFTILVSAGTVGMGKPWVGTAAQASGCMFTLALLPLLLPSLEAKGAAIASTIAYAMSAIVAAAGLSRILEAAESSASIVGPVTLEVPRSINPSP